MATTKNIARENGVEIRPHSFVSMFKDKLWLVVTALLILLGLFVLANAILNRVLRDF